MTKSVVILAGPTASGKSALALDIAQETGVVIINADSKQVFREIPIITAQPTPKEQKLVSHALYGEISVAEHCSVSRWLAMAKEAVEHAWLQKKTPLLVGGTGLYMQALIEGLSPIPDIDAMIRRESREWLASVGSAVLHDQLRKLDPQMAERLKPGDSQRVVRAFEVVKQTGKSLLYWQGLSRQRVWSDVSFCSFFLNHPRHSVYENCNQRFKKMIDAGVVDEIRALDAFSLDEQLPALRAHGVPEIRQYLRGAMTMEEAVRIAQRNTRHYIKRQYTWFSHQMADCLLLEGESNLQLVSSFLSRARGFLLT